MDPDNRETWRTNKQALPYKALGIEWFNLYVPYNQTVLGQKYPDQESYDIFKEQQKLDMRHVFKDVSVTLSPREIHQVVALTMSKLRLDKPRGSKKKKPLFGVPNLFGGGRGMRVPWR